MEETLQEVTIEDLAGSPSTSSPSSPVPEMTAVIARFHQGTGPVEQRATSLAEDIAAFLVPAGDDPAFAKAQEYISIGTAMLDEIADAFDGMIADWNKGHKNALAKKARYYAPVSQAVDGLKKRWAVEFERRRQQAERERQDLEQRLRAEAEARQAAEVQALEVEGRHEEAAVVKAEPIATPMVSSAELAARLTPRSGGVQAPVKQWSAEVVSLNSLLEAVLAGKVPVQAVAANMPYLNKRAELEKETFTIPGVKAVWKPSVSVRRPKGEA